MDPFVEISALLVIAAVVSILMRALHQPLIIGYILTGLVVGPAVLGLIDSYETLEVFSSFGIALLLFIVGLGLNPKVVKEVGRVSVVVGLGQIVLTALLSFGIATALGYSPVTALYIAIALAFSSTIIVLKMLSDKKDQNKLYGKIAIGILLVQDIVATIALLTASATAVSGLSYVDFLTLAAKGGIVVSLVLLFVQYVLQPMNGFLAKSSEMLFLFAMAWGFGIASLTYLGGFSLEVGALFAGVALAGMPYAQEIASRLRPLRDFFIVVFFIVLGSTVEVDGLHSVFWQALILSAFVLILKPFIVMWLMSILGYTKKTSFKAGLSLAQISEFSIIFILLGYRNGQVSDEVVTLITLVGIFTIAASTYLMFYSKELYAISAKFIPYFREKSTHREHERHHRYSLILFGYHHGGYEFLRAFKEMHKKYLVVDYDPETIDLLERNNVPHLYGDAEDVDLLEEIGLEKAELIASTITDFDTNMFLAAQLERLNPDAVSIFHANNLHQAEQLYAHGASYVMLPHYIGSERMGAFIRKNGADKEAFRKFGEEHQKNLKPILK